MADESLTKSWDFHHSPGAVGRKTGFAVDLGCGSGRDTLHLLRRGWRVLAIDREPLAFDYLNAQVDWQMRPLLSTLSEPMETASLAAADLINASASLPFCRPQFFGRLWRTIAASVAPGGRFAGHFFGEQDSWAHEITQTHHTRCSVLQLFEGWHLEHLEEIRADDPAMDGEAKHWHVFHVVAKKR